MLEQEALARMLEQLRTEQAAAEADLIVLQRRVNSLRQAVAGIDGLLESDSAAAGPVTPVGIPSQATVGTPEIGIEDKTLQDAGKAQDALAVTSPLPTADRPRGAEAVRRVFAESEGTGWTVQEMTAELERRRWTPDSKNPVDAVRTAMTRVWRAPNSGVIREGSKFLYRPSHNGDGSSAREGVSGDQEMSEAALAFTEDSQQSDTSPDQS
jgi:hypothetical protein